MKDPDIFGGSAPAGKDTEIFADVPKSETPEASDVPKPPVKAEPNYRQDMVRGATEVLRGLVTGGMPGMVAAGAGAAMRHVDDLTDRAATAGGGKVTDLAAPHVEPETAAKLGFVTNVGIRAIPAIAGGEFAKLAAPSLQRAGRTVMQSALKPDYASLRSGKAARAIETMLQEGKPVTEGGLLKLRTEISNLGDEVNALVGKSTATVDSGAAGKELTQVYDKLLKGTNREANLEILRKHWGEFRSNPLFAGRQDQVPVQVMQEVKRQYSKDLGSASFGEKLKSDADRDVLKGIKRGMKNVIADAVPGVAAKNAAMSEKLNAAEILERRLLTDQNKALLGLSPFAWNPIGMALFMLDRMPGVKSNLARSLYSGAEQIPANAARVGIGYGMLPPEEERGALYDAYDLLVK
jgi:hypothetical protein